MMPSQSDATDRNKPDERLSYDEFLEPIPDVATRRRRTSWWVRLRKKRRDYAKNQTKLVEEINNAGWINGKKPRLWKKRIRRATIILALILVSVFVASSARSWYAQSQRLVASWHTPAPAPATATATPTLQVVVNDKKLDELRRDFQLQLDTAKKEWATEMTKALAARATVLPEPEPFPKITVINPFVHPPENVAVKPTPPLPRPIPAPPKTKAITPIVERRKAIAPQHLSPHLVEMLKAIKK